MQKETSFDWRRSDRRIFAIIALLFPAIILVGFARTYYLGFGVAIPPLPSTLVHVHGALMSAWVAFFIAQVWLIRSKNVRIHMKLGILGIVLGAAIAVVGFFTAVASAKFGSAAVPPGFAPLVFVVVPLTDISLFVLFFGAAIFYRKRPAIHKRMMLLTVFNFLPPGLGRFPFDFLASLGPLFFMGVPTFLALAFLVYDSWTNKKVNFHYLVGAIILIASYPLRFMLAGTDAWLNFASWLTTWAA